MFVPVQYSTLCAICQVGAGFVGSMKDRNKKIAKKGMSALDKRKNMEYYEDANFIY